mmetsp:Transcript_77420/g.169438  ORF Transcript_77420/g.169438 Transcript_77420/m.169438 type:complete len:82 (-) Transcript_77420:364-609(-)
MASTTLWSQTVAAAKIMRINGQALGVTRPPSEKEFALQNEREVLFFGFILDLCHCCRLQMEIRAEWLWFTQSQLVSRRIAL